MGKRSAGSRDDATGPSFRPSTQGAEQSARWLLALGLPAMRRWHAEIELTAGAGTTFELNIYAEEWGFVLQHDGHTSWIRITDIPFVHGHDDFHLLPRTPDLLAVSVIAAELEAEHGITFDRANATIRTNLPGATETIRGWLLEPLPYTRVKKTVELCGDVMHDGIHCSKVRGHDGVHEYVGLDGRSQLRWK